MTYDTNDLAVKQSITAVVAGYVEIMEKMTFAGQLLEECKQLLRDTTKDEHPWILDRQFSDYNIPDSVKNSKRIVKQQIWRYLFNISEIRDFMGIKDRQNLDDQLANKIDELPEPSLKVIMDTFARLMSNTDELLTNAIKEVFEWLRPYRCDEYMTNMGNEFNIGKKIIKEFCVECYYGDNSCMHVRHSFQANVKALENAFTMLDGKGINHSPNDLVTRIDDAGRNGVNTIEDAYFKIKWYKKGTLHVEIKRLDLLEKLNRIGSGGRCDLGQNQQ